MKVKEAIELLKTMPQDAVLIASTEGMAKMPAHGSLRENQPPKSEMLLTGFSAAELVKEEYEIFLFEKEGLVVLALVTNSQGGELA